MSNRYLKKEKQMVDQYNEASQLRVRLAILESQLKMANNRIKHLENTNKDESSQAKLSHQAGWIGQHDPYFAG
jgi:hypothetical protein